MVLLARSVLIWHSWTLPSSSWLDILCCQFTGWKFCFSYPNPPLNCSPVLTALVLRSISLAVSNSLVRLAGSLRNWHFFHLPGFPIEVMVACRISFFQSRVGSGNSYYVYLGNWNKCVAISRCCHSDQDSYLLSLWGQVHFCDRPMNSKNYLPMWLITNRGDGSYILQDETTRKKSTYPIGM